jgi:hypothetical protein
MTKTELCVLIYDDTMLKLNFNHLRLNGDHDQEGVWTHHFQLATFLCELINLLTRLSLPAELKVTLKLIKLVHCKCQ